MPPLMVDPNAAEEHTSHPTVKAGDRLMAVVGIDRGTSANRNPIVNVRMTCVRDLSPNVQPYEGEFGYDGWETFTLTQNAIFKLGLFTKAAGYTKPFDAMDDAQLQEALMSGPVVVTFKAEPYTDRQTGQAKIRHKADKFRAYDGQIDPADPRIAETMSGGEERHEEYRKRKAEKASKAPAGGGGQRPPDDEIPF